MIVVCTIRCYNKESVCLLLSIVPGENSLPELTSFGKSKTSSSLYFHFLLPAFLLVFHFLSIYVAYKNTQNSLLLCSYETPLSSRRTCSTNATACGSCLTYRELLKREIENEQQNLHGLYSLRLFCFPSKFIKAARPPWL